MVDSSLNFLLFFCKCSYIFPGQTFAMMSMKMTICTILRKYVVKKDQITPIKDIRIKLDTLLRAVEPVTVRFERRIVNS